MKALYYSLLSTLPSRRILYYKLMGKEWIYVPDLTLLICDKGGTLLELIYRYSDITEVRNGRRVVKETILSKGYTFDVYIKG